MNPEVLMDQVAAGLRMALVLLAVLIVMTKGELGPDVSEDTRLRTIGVNSAAWCLVALAVLALSPLRALSLLRHPIPPGAMRLGEIVAVSLTCWAFIRVLSARALLRGVSAGRVTAGQRLLVGVVLLSIVAAGVSS